jgi:hypothetical protein
MKTNELIALLAQQDPRPARSASGHRVTISALFGLVAATLLVAAMLGFRENWSEALRQPMFWWKLAYAVSLGVAALLATVRLASPGRKVGRTGLGLAVPPAIAIAAALAVLWLAPAGARAELIRGQTWQVCALLIAMLSIPAFAAVMWAIRGLAPTRLRAAGAAGGLLAGALATIAYCVHCPESQVPFWAVWYTAGMLIPAGVGAFLGPRLLRW